jgi:hypothetical protein
LPEEAFTINAKQCKILTSKKVTFSQHQLKWLV